MGRKLAESGHLDRVVGECIAVRVRLINRVVTALYDDALRPHGMRVSQGNILVAVAHLGEPRPAALCRRLRIERSTLSRDVELMKKNGWLEAEPVTGGRNQRIRVTAEGMKLLRAALPDWERAQAEASQLIGEDGVAAVHRIAARLGLGKPADSSSS
jgi:DNA-binding MarR family transcriptional regulator